MATKDVRDRIIAIIDAIAAEGDSNKTTMKRLRNYAQDYEGYIMRVRMAQSNNQSKTPSHRDEGHTWLIEVYSPKAGLGHDSDKEDKMYDYRDAILAAFQNNSVLHLTGGSPERLPNTGKAVISSDRFRWGDTSLDGVVRYKWEATLTLGYRQSC